MDLWNNMRIPVKFSHALLRGMYFYFRLDIKCLNVAISCFPWQDHAVILEKLMIHEGLWGKKESFNLLHRHPVKTHTHMKCSYFCAYCEFCASVCGWIITLYCVAFGLSQKCFPPEQERPASVRIGLGFSFSWNTFCSVLHGPTGDHSADIFRGHVPRASVAKREGQWRVWCYINTWRKWGKEKNPGWPWWVLDRLSSRNFTV